MWLFRLAVWFIVAIAVACAINGLIEYTGFCVGLVIGHYLFLFYKERQDCFHDLHSLRQKKRVNRQIMISGRDDIDITNGNKGLDSHVEDMGIRTGCFPSTSSSSTLRHVRKRFAKVTRMHRFFGLKERSHITKQLTY